MANACNGRGDGRRLEGTVQDVAVVSTDLRTRDAASWLCATRDLERKVAVLDIDVFGFKCVGVRILLRADSVRRPIELILVEELCHCEARRGKRGEVDSERLRSNDRKQGKESREHRDRNGL